MPFEETKPENPKIDKTRRVPLTEEIVGQIKAEILRTGIGVSPLLEQEAENCPPGLNAAIVYNWLRSRNRKITTAREDYLKFLLSAWNQYSDAPFVIDKQIKERHARTALSRDIIRKLQAEMSRTGIHITSLLKMEGERCPDGLSAETIYMWFKGPESGIKNARTDYLEFVLHAFQSYPNKETRNRQTDSNGPTYVPVTRHIVASILAHQRRTGISPPKLLRTQDNIPEGLTVKEIANWLNAKDNPKVALKPHVEYILNRYQALPNLANVKHAQPRDNTNTQMTGGNTNKAPSKEKRLSKKAKTAERNDLRYRTYVDISEKDLTALRFHRTSKLLPGKIFTLSQVRPPSGLNAYMVSRWLNESTKRADPEHLSWVLKQCDSYQMANRSKA
ncbi:MAG: hypothetical protein JNK00_00250 [Flavipsychrobacter sp.]|nr:hypothetical protein [Flavipsychrobacter sp.]